MALITKSDLEAELQTQFSVEYTDPIITGIITTAHNILMLKTNRTAFTGSAADLARYAELCLAIDRLVLSNRDLVKLSISSISENGASITFSNGKTLASYRNEANSIIQDLRIPGTRPQGLVFSDPLNEHTGTEGSIYY